jgi:glycyl-tRNA synthetase beta chain
MSHNRADQAASRRVTPEHSQDRLVFEIGTEELPPSAAWDGARQLRDAASAAFAAARISVGSLRTYSTPRRLALIADEVAPHQQDLVREVRGPAVRVAFTPDGSPTPAAEGFARAQGVAISALERRATEQGEYVFAERREAGGTTMEALPALLAQLANRLEFPRTMRWGTGPYRFPRPVRWVVALLGDRIVDCEVLGVRTGRDTMGHRALHPRAVSIVSAGVYESVLRRCAVLLDPALRRDRIKRGVAKVAREAGGRPILNPELLEETVQLVEWPQALAGRFAPEFLELPREILITVMQHHQKYFAVEDTSGRLLPAFVAVRNGRRRGLDTVREGNEWVLRARLADARFFFEEDRRRPLAARVDELTGLVFHEMLGTMRDKTRRLEGLAQSVEDLVPPGGEATTPLEREATTSLKRAAHLSKADLVTQVVRELPELQGIMGGIYARLDGEPEAVARAIPEQYLPRGTAVPETDTGAWLALFDKIDTLTGAFAAGITPTGSQDPYGLRRAAAGIVVVVLHRNMHFDLRSLVSVSLDVYAHARSGLDHTRPAGTAEPVDRPRQTEVAGEVLEFVRQRLRGALLDEGLGYDTVDAALAAGADDMADAAMRARALAAFRRLPAFARVQTAFDRAVRILPDGFDGSVRPEDLEHPAERGLFDAVEQMRPHVGAAIAARRYGEAFASLAGLADPVDRFFTDVLVMADDPRVRANRLALLAGIAELIRPIADLSRVEGEGKAKIPS